MWHFASVFVGWSVILPFAIAVAAGHPRLALHPENGQLFLIKA